MKEVLPPIIDNHLVLYLVIERNGSNGEKYEAYKNLNDSPQYIFLWAFNTSSSQVADQA